MLSHLQSFTLSSSESLLNDAVIACITLDKPDQEVSKLLWGIQRRFVKNTWILKATSSFWILKAYGFSNFAQLSLIKSNASKWSTWFSDAATIISGLSSTRNPNVEFIVISNILQNDYTLLLLSYWNSNKKRTHRISKFLFLVDARAARSTFFSLATLLFIKRSNANCHSFSPPSRIAVETTADLRSAWIILNNKIVDHIFIF